MTLSEHEVDEVDRILIPAAEAIREFTEYCLSLGIRPGQMLLVVRDRFPIARQILNESNPSLH